MNQSSRLHDDSTLQANMASYYPLALRWLNIMSDYIDQESLCTVTFITTFRQQLRQGRHKPNHDEAFEYLYQTEAACVSDRSYLPVPDESPCRQLATSRLHCQKLRLENSIFLCAGKTKWDTLLFEDELVADSVSTSHSTEHKECIPDNGDSSKGQNQL